MTDDTKESLIALIAVAQRRLGDAVESDPAGRLGYLIAAQHALADAEGLAVIDIANQNRQPVEG